MGWRNEHVAHAPYGANGIGVICENLKEIELARGERILCAIRRVDEHALFKIQHPASHAYARSCSRQCCVCRAPQHALYARQQFAGFKWFRNIVVCTDLQPDYAVYCIGGDSHHDDTDSRTALSQPSCYGKAVFIWQT